MEDAQIIELFFARSEDAISELDMKYGKLCHKLADNILASAQDAEECVNDAYLSTWNAIPPQRPESLPAFVGTLVRRCSITRYRANTAMK
jgi:DNA-directed RNA polymerase specialized sigma24 family protein